MHPSEVLKPTEIKWRPVTVQMRNGQIYKICGPLEAFRVLDLHRSKKRYHLYEIAKRSCRLAMERKMSADEARLAFIAATMEQNLRVV